MVLRGRGLSALPTLAAAIIVLVASGSGLVLGQGSTATITGSVKDVSGAVLQGAAITVKHLETGLTRTDEADNTGNFSIPLLPVGPYERSARVGGVIRKGTCRDRAAAPS